MLATQRITSTLKNLDNYRWATLLTWPLTTALLIFLIIHGGFLRPEWFIDLMMAPALISSLQSGTTYLARIIDGITTKGSAPNLEVKTLFNNHATTDRKAGSVEVGFTLGGAILGITVATLLIVGHETIPLLKSLHQFADLCFAMASLGIYAGLAGRIGSFFDRDPSGFDNPRKIGMAIVAVIGLGLGIALFVTGAASLITVFGVTNFFSGGAALPLWIMGFIFVAGFTNTLVSCSDYTFKTAYFLKFIFNGGKQNFREKMQARLHEYRGAAVGVTIGSCIAAVIIVSLLVTQPHLLVGIIGVAVSGICVVACANSIGSLCSKLGRMLDGFNKPKSPIVVNDQADNKPLVAQQLDSSPALNTSTPKRLLELFCCYLPSGYKRQHDVVGIAPPIVSTTSTVPVKLEADLDNDADNKENQFHSVAKLTR